MTAQMTVRERFRATMEFRQADRLPIIEWADWWNLTLERWRADGLPGDLDRLEMFRLFGLDPHMQDWVRAWSGRLPSPVRHGAGIIETEDDYERIRPVLFPRDRVDSEKWRQWAELQRTGGAILWFTLDGFFWFPRTLLGIERHLYAFYDQPELMHRINQDLADWMKHTIPQFYEHCTPDFMTFAEDMSYNNGPMISKELFEEFMAPYYHQVIGTIKDRGTHVIVDSDGDITMAAPWFEDAGIDGVLPLERNAGVDLGRLRKSHPQMRFIGHFDKLVMHKGEGALRAEFERLMPVMRQGGFCPSVDHQTPPAVSLADYRLYVRLFREYAERAMA